MKIKKVRLENFRGFEGVHEFELHSDHINVIIGANGAGKTSILDAISYPFFAVFSGSGNMYRQFVGKDVDKWRNKKDHRPDISYSAMQTEIKLFLSHSNKDVYFTYSFKEDKNYSSLEGKFQPKNYEFSDNPVFKKYNNRRELQTNEHYNHKSFSYWLKEQINIQNNEIVKKLKTSESIDRVSNYQIPSTSIISEALNTFMTNLTDNKFLSVITDKSNYKNELVLFIEKENGEKVEYSQLSSGEKAVFGILLEIAKDSFHYNENSNNSLHTPGIVLIDEIELHLHPKWQTSILQALNKTFPNIQFIVTTHSPLVINHLKNENLILLDDFKITEGINVQSVYGKDVNSIITDFMGASAKPKEVENLINDIEVLLDEEKPNINLAKEKLNALKQLVDPNESEVLKLETLITIEEKD